MKEIVVRIWFYAKIQHLSTILKKKTPTCISIHFLYQFFCVAVECSNDSHRSWFTMLSFVNQKFKVLNQCDKYASSPPVETKTKTKTKPNQSKQKQPKKKNLYIFFLTNFWTNVYRSKKPHIFFSFFILHVAEKKKLVWKPFCVHLFRADCLMNRI